MSLARRRSLTPPSFDLKSSLFQPQSVSTTIDYAYDPLYRLTAADYSTGDFYHYAYDAVGNRLTASDQLSETSYQYDIANRLTSANGVNYTWDGNGNLLNDGVNAYTYDSANRLVAVNSGQSSVTSYQYNGLDDRLSQTVDGVPTNYTLDLNTGLTQVLSDGTNTYTYGLGRISQTNTSTEYFLNDALGSVRQLTASNGDVTLAKSYDPYGVVTQAGGTSQSAYGYTGEAQDSYTNLVYLRARFYNPLDGRFQSRDTWGGDINKPMSYNAWLYVYANPINLTDPSGNKPPHPYRPCHLRGDQFCLLRGTYEGAFLDESHFVFEDAKEFLRRLKKSVGKGETLIPLKQSSPGYYFNAQYLVDIPKIYTSDDMEIAKIGAGIWEDFQKKFEAWQYMHYKGGGNHSAYNAADIPLKWIRKFRHENGHN